MLGRGLRLKATTLSVFLLWLVKSLKNLLITFRNAAYFLISSMVKGLSNQLQIFRQLYLIELVGYLIGLGLLEPWHMIYLRLFTGCDMMVFFTNSNIMELQFRYLTLCLLFSVIDGIRWFYMGSLLKINQLMLVFHSWTYTFPTVHE